MNFPRVEFLTRLLQPLVVISGIGVAVWAWSAYGAVFGSGAAAVVVFLLVTLVWFGRYTRRTTAWCVVESADGRAEIKKTWGGERLCLRLRGNACRPLLLRSVFRETCALTPTRVADLDVEFEVAPEIAALHPDWEQVVVAELRENLQRPAAGPDVDEGNALNQLRKDVCSQRWYGGTIAAEVSVRVIRIRRAEPICATVAHPEPPRASGGAVRTVTCRAWVDRAVDAHDRKRLSRVLKTQLEAILAGSPPYTSGQDLLVALELDEAQSRLRRAMGLTSAEMRKPGNCGDESKTTFEFTIASEARQQHRHGDTRPLPLDDVRINAPSVVDTEFTRRKGMRAWLKSEFKVGAWVLLAAAVVGLVARVLPFLTSLGPEVAKVLNHGLHLAAIVVVLMLMGFSRRPVLRDDERYRHASRAVARFWSFWVLAWIPWVLLYGLLIFGTLAMEPSSETVGYLANEAATSSRTARPQLILYALINILSNANAVFLFAAYHELSVVKRLNHGGLPAPEPWFFTLFESVDEHLAERRNPRILVIQGATRAVRVEVYVWGGLVLFASLLELLIAATLDATTVQTTSFWFSVASGIFAAVTIALLAQRLQSLLLGVSVTVLGALAVYAAIQPVFAFIDHSHLMAVDAEAMVFAENLLYGVALVGKLTLFITIHWLVCTDRLTYYMVYARKLILHSPEHRQRFLSTLREHDERHGRLGGPGE